MLMLTPLLRPPCSTPVNHLVFPRNAFSWLIDGYLALFSSKKSDWCEWPRRGGRQTRQAPKQLARQLAGFTLIDKLRINTDMKQK